MELIQSQHHPDDIGELIHYLTILVKDSPMKLQMSNECQKAGRDIHDDIAEPSAKYY